MKQVLRQHLIQTCSEQELRRWFDPLSLAMAEDGRCLEVGFPHAYFARWFEEGIRDRFEALLSTFLGDGCSVRYRESRSNGPAPAAKSESRAVDFPFDSQFTFETFMVNKKNYFPLASAREVAKQAGTLFNPFVVCGAGGSGKSHLLRAIANEISKRHDPARILLTSMQDIQTSYEGDRIAARARLTDHDFLFVDDLHLIRNSLDLQQEMISVFNHFYDNRKQMVFTSPVTIASCDYLDPMLRSRLEWGLIVTLKQPDLEVRVNYVQERCRTKKLMLSREQMLTLAQRFHDFRYLQGILLKLTAYRELVRKELDERDFEQILNNTEEKTAEALSPRTVIAIVAEHQGVNPKDILGSRRNQNIALARQMAMFLCRDLLGLSFPALGRAFGGKDHSTVLYSVKKIDQIQQDDQSLKKVLKDLKRKCLLAGEQGSTA
ncbi:MAG TPA: DnaA/Hda family protein [Desulfovibrio sp.]|uniref:DnaA ATPase domain-containing protein n=1 Tax=Desulfovibrio TaxID=872 RepID=UPI002A3F37EB|nr:DnaA/Hda family protein [Desulfovibrio sp.]MDY0306213.1 DnaA/Hda family protein [Desulfovibrionaceae bacterium]HMM39560.1 DnaA/Hda family protein [Desulfovibrio sp.]